MLSQKIMEVMKRLVETDDKDERMSIVEENHEMLTSTENPTNNEEMETLKSRNGELEAEIEAQKQKYRERFFGGIKADAEPTETEVIEEENPKSLNEILNNKGE